MQPAQKVKQTAKQIAISTARQAARESGELLKSVREQLSPSPLAEERQTEIKKQNEQKPPEDLAKLREKGSFMRELRQELEGIENQTLFKELQKRIAEGEEVPLIDYVKELTSEQREVLSAQMEAVKMQKEQSLQRKESIPQIVSKRARGMLGTFKKRNQQHVEMRQPPSG